MSESGAPFYAFESRVIKTRHLPGEPVDPANKTSLADDESADFGFDGGVEQRRSAGAWNPKTGFVYPIRAGY
jgi:hypothetical protein